MLSDRRLFLLTLGSASLAASLAACGGGAGASRSSFDGPRRDSDLAGVPFAQWTDREPEYLLYPGDEIEVATPTAAELTRTVKIGPDGRIALPLIGSVMAADQTLPQLQQALSGAYASQLIRPVVEVALRQAGPIRVWVDGEVRTPGVFEMVGDLEAYQAIIQAGGFAPTLSARSGGPDPSGAGRVTHDAGHRSAAAARRGRAFEARRYPVRAALDTGRTGGLLYTGSRRPARRLQLFDQRNARQRLSSVLTAPRCVGQATSCTTP